MTREQAENVIRDNFSEVWADGIIKALKPKPMEKFKSVKDHIFKLAGDYKCWDNRLTDDEALELCHILEQEPRWIPVSEKLPEESTAVLVYCPERKNTYCAYLEEGQWWIFGAFWEKVTEEVVAWMPLPQNYGEVEE